MLEDPAIEPPAYVYQRTISPMEAPDKATDITDRLRQGRCRQPRRQEAVAGHPARQAQRARPRQRHRPHRPGGEPLRRHEVARRLRDAGRHHPAGRAPRHGIDHARPRRRPPQGRADAALCGADLQRLLVLARARDAAGGRSTRARSTSRARCALKLYKGNVIVTGRDSAKSLYSSTLVTFEDDKGAYDQKDAEGFIRLNALRLRTLACTQQAAGAERSPCSRASRSAASPASRSIST